MTNHGVFVDLLICWFGLSILPFSFGWSPPTDYKGLEKGCHVEIPQQKGPKFTHPVAKWSEETNFLLTDLYELPGSAIGIIRGATQMNTCGQHLGRYRPQLGHPQKSESWNTKKKQICSIQWANLDHQWEPWESLEMMKCHDDVRFP